MKQSLILVLSILCIISCRKEDTSPGFINAGDTNNKKLFTLNFQDSIPKVEYSEFSEFEWTSTPKNIDDNEDFDIRIGYSWSSYMGEMYTKVFQIGNNSNGFEFAVCENDTVVAQFDTLPFIKIFNYGEKIDANQRWLEGDWDHLFTVSLYCKTDTTIFSINKDITDKYIGIRKLRNGNLIYGWISINLINHSHFKVKESCFNNQ
jgi:hypothetical protein